MLRLFLLLRGRFLGGDSEEGNRERGGDKAHLEGHESDDDAKGEEDEGLYEPDDSPYCVRPRRQSQRMTGMWPGGRLPRAEQHPQILAKALASEVFTLRAIVSSAQIVEREEWCHSMPGPRRSHATRLRRPKGRTYKT